MAEGSEEARVMNDEERARAMREQLKSLHAFDLAYEMMVSLVTFAYQKLGLTGETAELRHLDDAHYAIELFGALLNVSEREHGGDELRDLRSTLANLQLGYVQALELEGTQPAEAVTEPAKAAAEADEAAVEPNEAAAETVAQEQAAESAAAPTKPAAKKATPKKPAAQKPAAAKATRPKAARKKPAPKPDDAG
jgi:hypothetical protein